MRRHLSSPRHVYRPTVLCISPLALAIRFSIAKSKTINAQLRNLPFESPICHWHAARSPHRSLGASITITAIGGTQGKGRDGDILAYRSHDLGKNWLGPVKVNDVDGSGREGLHAMTSGDDGALWCVWLDLREKAQCCMLPSQWTTVKPGAKTS